MNYIVSRHPGAVDWMRRRMGGQPFEVFEHLEPGFRPAPGERVCGVLPLTWVERIHRAGAECWVLEVELPAALRGKELSAEQLDALQARLVRYEVQAVDCRN